MTKNIQNKPRIEIINNIGISESQAFDLVVAARAAGVDDNYIDADQKGRVRYLGGYYTCEKTGYRVWPRRTARIARYVILNPRNDCNTNV